MLGSGNPVLRLGLYVGLGRQRLYRVAQLLARLLDLGADLLRRLGLALGRRGGLARSFRFDSSTTLLGTLLGHSDVFFDGLNGLFGGGRDRLLNLGLAAQRERARE